MYKVLAVNYDLRKEGDYRGLIEELKNSPNWWHYLESTWLIHTEESPDHLWNRLEKHIHKKDNVLINEMGTNYTGWLPKKAWDWIRDKIQTANTN